MTLPESSSPDRPFPGAHSQVPGAHGLSEETPATPTTTARRLPLGAARSRSRQGWVIRFPVRAEQVTVTKEVVVRERVVLRRREIGDIAPVEATVRRERLQVGTTGPVDVVEVAEDDLGGIRET
ncbi:MAG TPA: DUF2382 domain-containing protein [Candidatus Sulfotelmatobacter sp.]|nr:DUF2382 domain-containing protein [Candidatus Sulfotelmatobacter sp.]